jgi:hypothetical protein
VLDDLSREGGAAERDVVDAQQADQLLLLVQDHDAAHRPLFHAPHGPLELFVLAAGDDLRGHGTAHVGLGGVSPLRRAPDDDVTIRDDAQ